MTEMEEKMKVVLPADNAKIESAVCVSFGRAPYFALYDTEGKGYSFFDNSGAESSGGAGIKAAQQIVDKGADILITPRCGENAADVLKASTVKIYKSTAGTIEENIQEFLKGELDALNEIHPGFHGKGAK